MPETAKAKLRKLRKKVNSSADIKKVQNGYTVTTHDDKTFDSKVWIAKTKQEAVKIASGLI